MRWNTQTYSGWGNALRATADVARPERHSALADLVAETDHILPIGARRSYGDAALTPGGHGLQTERLDRFLAFDAQTGVLEVEAGVRLGDILRVFAPRGWMPPVVPGTGMTTVGGAIANDVHGKNHHVDGSFGQHVKSMVLLTADGQSRRISASKDKTLFQATMGGVGQTGLVTCAELQLVPCPSTFVDVTERRMAGLDAFIEAFETSEAPYQVGWIDALAHGSDMGRGIMEEAAFAATPCAPFPKSKTKSVPLTAPSFAMSRPIVKLFNAAYLRKVPRDGRTVARPLPEFFFPLDKISNWNKLYGKKGFYQFQCVLPPEVAKDGLSDLLEVVSEGGIASPLAVLKKMGDGRSGHLSFPMPGYTLAVDLPARNGTPEILKELGQITTRNKGRVYLAKDGAASADEVAQMYPEIEKFRATVQKVDPDGKFASAMSKRLNLRGQP